MLPRGLQSIVHYTTHNTTSLKSGIVQQLVLYVVHVVFSIGLVWWSQGCGHIGHTGRRGSKASHTPLHTQLTSLHSGLARRMWEIF